MSGNRTASYETPLPDPVRHPYRDYVEGRRHKNGGLPGYYSQMCCRVCGCFFPATSPDTICKQCGSSDVAHGSTWQPDHAALSRGA